MSVRKKARIARFKLQRRLLMELPGLGKPGAMERKPYPPGQHGQRRKKYSEFGLQLEEKQKLRIHYGLKETQMRRFVHMAKRDANSNWVEKLTQLLERRLDNIIFRAGFASSIAAAKQIISHRKVLVNGKKVDIRSYLVDENDMITLTPAAYKEQTYNLSIETPRLTLPDYLELTGDKSNYTITVKDLPSIEHVPFVFEAGLVTGYYSLRG